MATESAVGGFFLVTSMEDRTRIAGRGQNLRKRVSTSESRGRDAVRSMAMTEHAVVIAGGGPTGLMLAGELALAGSTSPLSSGAPTRNSLARVQAVCRHAPS